MRPALVVEHGGRETAAAAYVKEAGSRAVNWTIAYRHGNFYASLDVFGRRLGLLLTWRVAGPEALAHVDRVKLSPNLSWRTSTLLQASISWNRRRDCWKTKYNSICLWSSRRARSVFSEVDGCEWRPPFKDHLLFWWPCFEIAGSDSRTLRKRSEYRSLFGRY